MKGVSRILTRKATTVVTPTKAQGDISSVFPSLSGKKPEPLPTRFKDLKYQLAQGRERQLAESYSRLLVSLREEVEKVKELGSKVSRSCFIYQRALTVQGYTFYSF